MPLVGDEKRDYAYPRVRTDIWQADEVIMVCGDSMKLTLHDGEGLHSSLATALLDRLTHRCQVLSFADNSYRLAQRKENFDSLGHTLNKGIFSHKPEIST